MTRTFSRRSTLAALAALVMGVGCTGTALADKSDFPEYDDTKAGEFKTTDSGLQYRIINPGSEAKPAATDKVNVNYHGTLPDGRTFDSSFDRGEPISFPLNGVIPGWTEGLQLIGEGGQIQLVIPPDLAYGQRGAPGSIIGPNQTLHFDVELLKIQ